MNPGRFEIVEENCIFTQSLNLMNLCKWKTCKTVVFCVTLIYNIIMKQKHNIDTQILPKIRLNKKNLVAFIIGTVVIIIGFILLSVGPWDNPISLSVAPIILLLGYVVIFPMAIFIGSKKAETNGDISNVNTAKKQSK